MISIHFKKKPGTEQNYHGFIASAAELVRFLETADGFVILLTNGKIVHHRPDNATHFRRWLKSHHIKELSR